MMKRILGILLLASSLGLAQTASVGNPTPERVPFASLPSIANGSIIFCPDCLPTNPCSGGGTTGSTAIRLNSAWNCAAGSPSVPSWVKYALLKIANGVNGCANANGCWQINGVLGPNASGGFTQDVTLFQLPGSGYVESARIKSHTACTGPTTAVTGLGTASSNTYYRAATYDIEAAVTATNFTDAMTTGSDTTATVNVVASLVTTVTHVDQIANGCAVDYQIKWGVLP